MTEELNRKADHLSLAYKTKYSEDRTLKDMLSRPKDFVEGAIEGIINLLRQKAWRDGYIAGATENGFQWHDLRKDPNDLPKEDCEVFAIVESDGTLYKSVENYYLDKTDTFDGWGTCQKVVAWLDPQFKE